MEQSRLAQRQADKWLISGSILIGTAALGIFGLPLFLRGVWLLRKAQRDGLSVRPMLVTLLGYLVIIDAAINTVGWALDMVANHTLLARVLLDRLGQHVRRRLLLALQRAVDRRRGRTRRKGLGDRADPHRLHHAHRRGDRVPADEAVGPPVDDHHLLDGRGDLVRLRVQHDHVRRRALCRCGASRSIGWWLYDIFYITPFLAIPYLHSVNREIFSD